MRITTQEAAAIIGLTPRQVTHILEKRIIRPEWMPLTGERNRTFSPKNLIMLGIARILYYQFHLGAGEVFGVLDFLMREQFFSTQDELRATLENYLKDIPGGKNVRIPDNGWPDDEQIETAIESAETASLEKWLHLDRLYKDRRFYLGVRSQKPGPEISLVVSFRHALERTKEGWIEWLTKHTSGLMIDLHALEIAIQKSL